MGYNLIKISELARRAQVLASTIRHYTDLGILRPASQTRGGHNLYEETQSLNMIRRVKALSRQGKDLLNIAKELEAHKRLLIVEDDAAAAEWLRLAIITRLKWPCEIARDAFEAGQKLALLLPDIMILDLHLPGMDGLSLLRRLRQDEELRLVKVLAVTGYPLTEASRVELKKFSDGFLEKPFEESKLVEVLESLAASGVFA